MRDVPSTLTQQYETVHNVVQLGADHTGTHSVNDVLDAEIGDQTALYFPRGEYRLERGVTASEFRNLALVGNRALVRPPQGFTGSLFEFGMDSDAEGLRFEGIDFDLTAATTGARPIHAAIQDGLLVRDVTVYGRQDVDHDSMRFDVTNTSGSGRVEALRLPDGSVTTYPNTGIYVGEKSVGSLTFVDCHVAGFPDNGLYASPASGNVTVRGGIYANNGIAGVRVSGSSRIEDVRVICDSTRPGLENMRGIRLREGTDVVVTGCTVEMRKVTESDGGITMAEWLEGATIRDTVVRTDANDVPGILAKRPNRRLRRSRSSDSRIALEDVRVLGRAANETAIAIDNRHGCQFNRVCIDQPGPNRDGITLKNSTEGVLTETVIDVTGEPLVLDDAQARRQRLRIGSFGRNCHTAGE